MKKYLLLFVLLLPSQLFPARGSKRSRRAKKVCWSHPQILRRKQEDWDPEKKPLRSILRNRPPKPLAPWWLKPPGEIISPPNRAPQFWSKVVIMMPMYHPGFAQPSHYVPMHCLVPSHYAPPPKKLTLIKLKNTNQENS